MNRDDLEKKLQQSESEVAELREQLAAAQKELESLSYSISHDLRAPLRAIKGFSEAILEDYRERLDDDGKRFLEIIVSSTVQITRLIDGLLALSRLERAEMHPEEIDVNELVHGIITELRLRHEKRKIDFKVSNLPPVRADLNLLRHIWTNLLENSVKFSAPQENAAIQVGGCKKDGEVSYFVKDNGVGFDMKYAEKLFGVFQRFHTEREFEGVGVGLAITKRLIKRHQGNISAESKPGEGTTMTFSLPG